MNAADTQQYLSTEKRDALLKEVEHFKKEKIPELAKRIDDARQMGDLSENAEYHAAREEMSWAQSQIKEMQYILDNSQVVKKRNSNTAQIGGTLTVETNGKKKEFTIVGAQEADPLHGKISNESPLGQALLDTKKGDRVSVTVPAGVQEYTIIDVR